MPANKTVRPEKVTRGGDISKARPGRKSSFLSKANAKVCASIREFGGIISLGDLADVFDVTSQTVRKWIAAGYLPEAFFPQGHSDRKLYVKAADAMSKINAAIANQAC